MGDKTGVVLDRKGGKIRYRQVDLVHVRKFEQYCLLPFPAAIRRPSLDEVVYFCSLVTDLPEEDLRKRLDPQAAGEIMTGSCVLLVSMARGSRDDLPPL